MDFYNRKNESVMARFILIDNWLESVGGHNYQYAMEILQAATNSEYQAVLATAKSFKKEKDTIPTDWTCYPIFRYAWNRTHTVGVDGKRSEPIDINGRSIYEKIPDGDHVTSRYKRWSRLLQRWDRQRRIKAFRNACRHLFDRIGFDPADIIFFPSVSDFDFLGLAAYLASNKDTQKLQWHVQFHYDIFDGRPPDFNNQTERKKCMEQQFSTAIAAIRTHHLHFYATTPQIADQYNRLRVGSFCPLPYPISCPTDKAPQKCLAAKKPLRVTLAGAPRREKGKRELNHLFNQLHKANVLGNDLQLWMQGNIRKLARQLSAFDEDHLANAEPGMASDAKIVVVPHPLDRKKYLKLIQQTDIGLLPYNNARYHARASGVFIEMLSAGVPVIVTAGSWLALQLAEPIYQHLEQMLVKETPTSEKFVWQGSSTNDDKQSLIDSDLECATLLLAGDSQPVSNSFKVPTGTGSLLIQFPWHEQRPGYFIRLRTFQLDRSEQSIKAPTQTILSQREEGKLVSSLIAIDPKADQICVELSNAYHDDTIAVGIPRITFLKRCAKDLPTGAVGLIASDVNQIPDLLDEMILHHTHYKTSAMKHAKAWNFKHAPLRTLEKLIEYQVAHKTLRGVA